MYVTRKLLNAVCRSYERKARSFVIHGDKEVILYPDECRVTILTPDLRKTITLDCESDLITKLMNIREEELLLVLSDGQKTHFDLDLNRYLVSALYDGVATDEKLPQARINLMKYQINQINADNASDFMRECADLIIRVTPVLTSHVAEIVDVHLAYSEEVRELAKTVMEVSKMLREEANLPERKDILIVDVYNKNNNLNRYSSPKMMAVQNLYKIAYETGVLAKLSFEYRDYDNYTYFACYKDDLLEFAGHVVNADIDCAIDAINTCGTCAYTGAIQPGNTMMSYRDVDGCVTKVRELWYTQLFINEVVYRLCDERKRNGNVSCIELLFKLMAFK